MKRFIAPWTRHLPSCRSLQDLTLPRRQSVGEIVDGLIGQAQLPMVKVGKAREVKRLLIVKGDFVEPENGVGLP